MSEADYPWYRYTRTQKPQDRKAAGLQADAHPV